MFYQSILRLIALFVINFLVIYISDRIYSSYLKILEQSTLKSKQILDNNNFLQTILNQEQIRIIYYYPDDKSASLVSNNFSAHLDNEIPDFLAYIRAQNLVAIEYFGMIQNAFNISIAKGFCSIILPVTLSESTLWMKMNGTKVVDAKSNRVKIIISITNINDLKRVELKFKNALNQCSISIWEYDIKNDKVFNYSDLILDYYFYGKDIEKASQSLVNHNLVYYNDIEIFKDGFERVKRGDNEVSFEIRVFPSRNGYYTWVRINFTCFKDSSNLPSNAWVSIESIDDAKASEKWFEIERKKNFDNKSGLIVMAEVNVTRNFVISHSSQFGEKMRVVRDNSINALIDSLMSTGVTIDNIEQLYESFTTKFLLESYEKGERVIEHEYKIITQSQDVLYVSNVTKLFLDLKTKEIIAFTFIYDITQNVVLRLSIDSIIKSKFVYLAYVNIINSHLSVSRTQLHDVTDTSNINRIYKDEWAVFIEKYVHEDDKEFAHKTLAIENIRKQMKYKRVFSFEYRISDNGNMIGLRRCHFVKTDVNSPFIIILEENVADRMISRIKNELVLKEALNQATQAASAKSEFLSRMSHEIRTPLSAIIGLSELGYKSKTVVNNDYFYKIGDSAQYLLGLMNDILDMNKLELGQIKLNPEYVDTDDFYSMILTIIKNQAEKKNIQFSFNREKPYFKYQYLEKLRVQQILLNVLNNAIKYTNNNGKVSYTIKNSTAAGKLFAIHSVSDNGVGISKEFINKVFSPFTREKNSLSDTEGGTGLGLAICSNLVKQLKGDIKIDSELNAGTTITITLPITAATKDQYIEATGSREDFDDKKMFIGKKILIAEDHKVNAMIIQTILHNNGIATTHVVNGIQAVEVFVASKEHEYDMILMDIMMPELNGLDATRQIRALDRKDAKTIAIIALSANAFDEDKSRSLECGMNDHLKKPIELKVLKKTFNKYL